MKYLEKEFTNELKNTINQKETALKNLLENLVDENNPDFVKKGLVLYAEFERRGNDPFHPGYNSSIAIGISDKNDELMDLHNITIWDCDRYFLGLTISLKIPGSKVVGELVDESVEDLEIELKEYIHDQLEELVP